MIPQLVQLLSRCHDSLHNRSNYYAIHLFQDININSHVSAIFVVLEIDWLNYNLSKNMQENLNKTHLIWVVRHDSWAR